MLESRAAALASEPDSQAPAPATLPDEPESGDLPRKAFVLGWHVAELYNFQSLMN